MKQQEMVKLTSWALCLCDEQTNSPMFFYNSEKHIFQSEFTIRCAFLDEKAALNERDKLNLDGVAIIKGVVEHPKELLTKAIVDTLSELI